jgi:hypothetical protein
MHTSDEVRILGVYFRIFRFKKKSGNSGRKKRGISSSRKRMEVIKEN